MSVTRLARFAGVAAVLASTAVVSTTADASAGAPCPGFAKFMVTVKAGVYGSRDEVSGNLQGLIKYKNPGDYVVGGYVGQDRYLLVQLGTSDSYGYMRADKAIFSHCV